MKKVLQISKYYYPFIGGTEQVARDIVNALRGEGVEQKVICFNENSSAGDYVTYRHETVYDHLDGIEVIRCESNIKVSSQALSRTYSKELDKLMKDFKPDIVIFHYPNPFVAYLLLKYKKYPFKLWIYWHLDITKQVLLKHVFYQQNLDLIKRSDRILGATPIHVEKSTFSHKFGGKKTILPYAIDENRMSISLNEKENAIRIREQYNGKVLCLFVGRHVPYKGLAYLIEAAENVNENIHFLIAGNGELTEKLKEKSRNNKKVEFIGRINDSDWRSYLYSCDIFCFPSITRNEGFGLALAEGMYYGKPAVTFTIPGSGVNYVNIHNKTGYECTNGNSKEYAKAINELAENIEIREKFGENARRRVLENFTFSQFKKNILALIEQG